MNNRDEWDLQYGYDRENFIKQLDNITSVVDKLCDRVDELERENFSLKLKQALMFPKIAGIAAAVSLIATILGLIFAGFWKLAPLISKLSEVAPKK